MANHTRVPADGARRPAQRPSSAATRRHSGACVGSAAPTSPAGAARLRLMLEHEQCRRDVGDPRAAILRRGTVAAACGSAGGTSAGSAVQSGSVFSTLRRACRVTSSPSNARCARQHLVEHAPERPDVAALVRRASLAPAPAPCTPRCRGSRRRRSSSPGVVIVGDCDDVRLTIAGRPSSALASRSRAP